MMLQDSALGKSTVYIETYTPTLLFPIPRTMGRNRIGLTAAELPFCGKDIWNGFELSWLNSKGVPQIAYGEFIFPCTTSSVIESKSFKLYLNSFNQSSFDSIEVVRALMEKDLSQAAQGPVSVTLSHWPLRMGVLAEFPGLCLDGLDIETDTYEVNPEFLRTLPSADNVEETIYSNLLKSNCLATGQPDWGSILVRYSGPQICHEGLLKYVISFRRHSGFAEHCVEQMFCDILARCRPDKLTVYLRYTRRGGLDINPFRSNFQQDVRNIRQFRQ